MNAFKYFYSPLIAKAITHTAIKDEIILSVCITQHLTYIFYTCSIISKDMLRTTYAVLVLVGYIIRCEATGLISHYAIKINENPKSSCHKIANIKSNSICLGTCRIKMDRIVMISHDESTKTCMCCNDINGNVLTGPNWKSYMYVPRKGKYIFSKKAFILGLLK